MARRRPPSLRGPVSQAMTNLNRMRLGYVSKKAGNRYIRREIRPYEVSRGALWATDTLHGAGQIHRFNLDRIQSLRPIKGTRFRPQWPVQDPLPGDLRTELAVARERVRAAREALRDA